MERKTATVFSIMAAILVIAGCSTMSRTEKQLARVDSSEIGKEPLKKAIRKYGAEIKYDYRITNAIAIRIPDPDKMEEAILYFEKVKGVLQVSRDRINYLNRGPSMNFM